MKIISDDDVHNYSGAIAKGGLKGATVGVGLSAGITYWLKKRSGLYRSMTPTVKTFFFLAPVLMCGVTATEWASLQYEEAQYDFGEAEKAKMVQRDRVKQLPTLERWKIQASNHKYKIIVGAWAASLGGSFWWINRDKYLSKSQKIVQARMYAQALTVAILLGSMLMTHNSYASPSQNPLQDPNSWQSIAHEEELREEAAGIPLRIEHPHSHSSAKNRQE